MEKALGKCHDGFAALADALPYTRLDKGDDGECHAFCPLHVLHDGDGRPVPVGRTVLPPALAERRTDPRLPSVRPSCADDVLDVLRKG